MFFCPSKKPFNTSLTRIGELIERDKIAAAKSEWRWLLANADKDQKSMLAAHAATKRWNHLTVTASISAKMWDNITLRFPVAHKWWFNFYAEKHDIDPITLMSLARQESAMKDPEIQNILADPVMNQVLRDMSENPKAAMEHQKNPMIMAKVRMVFLMRAML